MKIKVQSLQLGIAARSGHGVVYVSSRYPKIKQAANITSSPMIPLYATVNTDSRRANDNSRPRRETPPNVQNGSTSRPIPNPTANSCPVTIGPTDRARHENDAAAPLMRARNSFAGAAFVILFLPYQ